MKIKFCLVFGQFLISSWIEKRLWAEPSYGSSHLGSDSWLLDRSVRKYLVNLYQLYLLRLLLSSSTTQSVYTKGQLISKGNFGVAISSKKRTWNLKILWQIFFVRFLDKSKKPKIAPSSSKFNPKGTEKASTFDDLSLCF